MCHQSGLSQTAGQSCLGVTLKNRAISTASGTSSPQAITMRRPCQDTATLTRCSLAPLIGVDSHANDSSNTALAQLALPIRLTASPGMGV